jgi:hypothetical protein
MFFFLFGLPASYSLARFSSAELTITESELSAVAAAATIGLRKPSAATGIPMAL